MRRFLVFTPILFILFLLQSYFWVPTYEEQTRGNSARMNEYIASSIGDAQILNPILSADSASSTIENKVFEGLLDRDEKLNFRGRLATHWEVFEEAYFYIDEHSADAKSVVELIRKAMGESDRLDNSLARTLENIEDITVLPSRTIEKTFKETSADQDEPITISMRIFAPARIKLTLKSVDQDLFKQLEKVLGEKYFDRFAPRRYVEILTPGAEEKISDYAGKFLQATEHNPIVLFYLRPGVLFHDGETFEADDVKFTYDAIMNPKNLSPRMADYEPVKSVEVIDPMTVRIVYKRLFSPALGTWSMGMLPSHLLNAEALQKEAQRRGLDPASFSMRQSDFNRKPIGCGPFKFREWKSDQYIILDRFDDYWEGAPNYKQYTFRVIPDVLTQEMEFYAGTVDNYGVRPYQVERLSDDPKFQSFSGVSFSYTYIGYNMRREIFRDRRVRKALGMAIDVEKIIHYVLYDQAEPLTGPFLKQTQYYNQQVQPLAYDPKAAIDLLAEAGYRPGPEGWLEKDGKPLRFTLISNQGNDIRQAIMSIAQDSWRKIGVDVRIDVLEWAVFIQERINKLDFDAVVLGWSMGIDPDLYQIWHSSQTGPNQLNFVGFDNAEADDLIVSIRQEYDMDRQAELSHRLHEIIAEEQPYTFLYIGKWTAILDKRIVIKDVDGQGRQTYQKITPTPTGNFTFHFNKWIKLPEVPNFSAEG